VNKAKAGVVHDIPGKKKKRKKRGTTATRNLYKDPETTTRGLKVLKEKKEGGQGSERAESLGSGEKKGETGT